MKNRTDISLNDIASEQRRATTREKRCPKCQTLQHVRYQKCIIETCDHEFYVQSKRTAVKTLAKTVSLNSLPEPYCNQIPVCVVIHKPTGDFPPIPDDVSEEPVKNWVEALRIQFLLGSYWISTEGLLWLGKNQFGITSNKYFTYGKIITNIEQEQSA